MNGALAVGSLSTSSMARPTTRERFGSIPSTTYYTRWESEMGTAGSKLLQL